MELFFTYKGDMNLKKIMERALSASRKYTFLDFAFLKLSLFSLGILCGTYFAYFFLKHIVSLWIIFIISYIWIMYRTFFKHMD